MSAPLRLTILGCTSLSTGELSLALQWVFRLTRPLEVSALVGKTLASTMNHAGVAVHVYPSFGQTLALRTIGDALNRIQPDVLLLADLVNFYGVTSEFGTRLLPLLDVAMQRCRVVGLDLFDFKAHAMQTDVFGRPFYLAPPVIPSEMGLLRPSPYLAPQRSSPGCGRYAMVQDGAPVPSARKKEARAILGLPESPVVLLTTSPWQHRLTTYPESQRVAVHFTALMMRLLHLAAARTQPTVLLHVGPQPLPVPQDVTALTYVHLPQVPAATFGHVLEATDLVLTPNCIATSAIKAATMRIPVAMLHIASAVERAPLSDPPDDPARSAVHQFTMDAAPIYPTSVWPLGFHSLLQRVMDDNPFADIQEHLDVLDGNRTVERLVALLQNQPCADELRHRQDQYFSLLMSTMDSPEQALTAALERA